MNPTLKDVLGSGVFLSVAGAFVWAIVHFARRYHPFAAFRSFAPENSALKYEKLSFARIGDNRYYHFLSFAFCDHCVIFRMGWFFGSIRDYYAVPLRCLHIPREAGPDIIATIQTGEVAMEIDKGFISALKRRGVQSR